jgi:pre-mRNA-splicing factor CDC5/CEF1
MKYGKNQWARISSLLTRKTPRQCKARWLEWLDPSIKKTEWAKEEDEKLLHLAKLMPTQWRTIGPVVGRTPAQCLERYQKLLDEAEMGLDQGPTSDDIRKLRPGEIDPDPESKPARPDPVDMDEDEKEMLSEARARLANTQGKKAKRKAREKQLMEARRLANVQKRRELKSANIAVVILDKYKYTGMDYNADIPFHRPQPAGFWDINEERLRESAEKKDMTNEFLSTLEGKRRMEIEDVERKKDYKKQKQQKENGETAIPLQLLPEKLKISNRRSLVLPEPQVTEQDLESIVKMGVSGEMARSMVTGAETPSDNLLGEYHSIDAPTPMRTARTITGTGDASIKSMARNLKALSSAQTPLLGQDINLEGDLEFATPLKTIPSTPNPLAERIEKTPLRDLMGINTPRINSFDNDTPRALPPKVASLNLANMFKKLPKPRNEFEIVLPEISDVKATAEEVEDMEDLEIKKQLLKKQREQQEFKRRSLVVQRGLPRPVMNAEQLEIIYKSGQGVDSLIMEQKAMLIKRDCQQYPLNNQPVIDNSKVPEIEHYDDYMLSVDDLLSKEMEEMALDVVVGPKLYVNYFHNPKTKDYGAQESKEEFSMLKMEMKEKAATIGLFEKRQQLKLGGYIHRHKTCLGVLNEKVEELIEKERELEVFRGILEREERVVASRIEEENKKLAEVAFVEQDLQDRYRELSVLKLEKERSLLT